MYNENYKTLLKIKEDINKWTQLQVYGLEDLILLKCESDLKIQHNPSQNPSDLSAEIEKKPILKLMCNLGPPNSQNNCENKNKTRILTLPEF